MIDWRAPAAAPFYRSTPVDPGRVVRRRVIRSKGRRVLSVEDDLMRPELTAFLDGRELPVIGDGALMAALGQARTHTMRDIVASIQAEQDLVIRAPAASVTYVEGGPGTGKTAVALHRAAYLLYQDRRRYAGGILIVSPTPLLVAYTEGVLPSLGEEGQVAIRAIGSLVDGAEATVYDSPSVASVKGSSRMLRVLRKAARGALELNDSPHRLRVVAFGRRLELEAEQLADVRRTALGGTAPVNLLRPRARKLLLDALWERSGAAGRHTDPELAAELRSSFDEDITAEDDFIAFLDAWWPELTPAAVLDAMADERRLGRWARRILNPGEVRKLARSLKRDGRSVHDIAMLDELQAILGAPARPRKRREIDPLDQLTGLEELMPVREESQRERAERLAQERVEYAHVIVDEAHDLTPMQWRMVGRRGRHATWTVVGDPAQSSWSDPDEAAQARDEALGTRPRRRFELTVNYRNPAEIAELASKVLALAMPGSDSPSAVRSTGVEPRFTVGDDRWPTPCAPRRPGCWSAWTARWAWSSRCSAARRRGAGSPGSATGWWRWAAWRRRAWSTTRRWSSRRRRRRRVPGRPAGALRRTDPGHPAADGGSSAERDEPDAAGVPDLLQGLIRPSDRAWAGPRGGMRRSDPRAREWPSGIVC
ncbi:hypothetical protein SGLAM104S_08899 [Streptomyces glaucescens]